MTLVGHSLGIINFSRIVSKVMLTVWLITGSAIATLDLLYLHLNLPSSIKLKLVGYGTPRVGNQAFADYVDATFPGAVTRVTHDKVNRLLE